MQLAKRLLFGVLALVFTLASMAFLFLALFPELGSDHGYENHQLAVGFAVFLFLGMAMRFWLVATKAKAESP